jgi:hypothetical protein
VTIGSVTRTRLQELGDALDHAEATDPSLRPRQGCNAFARRAPAPWERLQSGSSWLPPQHPAVRAYWRELKGAIGQHAYAEGDLRTCRRNYKRAWQAYENLTVERDSGFFLDHPTLRAILDARAVVVESYAILEQVEAVAKYQRDIEAARRRASHNAKLTAAGQALARAIKQSITGAP